MANQSLQVYLAQYFGRDIENSKQCTFKEAIMNDVFYSALDSAKEFKSLNHTPIDIKVQFITRGISLLWSAPYLVLRFFRKLILFFIDQISLGLDQAEKESSEELSSPFYQFLKAIINIIFFIPEGICFIVSKIGDVVLGSAVRLVTSSLLKSEASRPEIPMSNPPAYKNEYSSKIVASSTMNISKKIITETDADFENDVEQVKSKVIDELQSNRDFIAREAAIEKNKIDKYIDILSIENLLDNLELRHAQQEAHKKRYAKRKAIEIEQRQLQADLDSLTSLLKSLSTYADLYARALVVAGQINDKIRLLALEKNSNDNESKPSPKLGGHHE